MYGCDTIFSIFEAAVKAATVSEPKLLSAACIIITPIAVTENWNAIGRPTRRCCQAKRHENAQSSLCRRRTGKRFRLYSRHSSADTACAMMVAHAAPATPIWNSRMQAKSSTMLMIQAMIRKIKGVLLSPSARRILENRLKNTDVTIP